MATEHLPNPSTQRGRATAFRSFERFLSTNHLTLQSLIALVREDHTGQVFSETLNHYALFLVKNVGQRGRQLSKNTVMTYYRAAKNMMLDANPEIEAKYARKFKQITSIIDKCCGSRQEGASVK